MVSEKLVVPSIVLVILGILGLTVYRASRSLLNEAEIVQFDRWVACEACKAVYRGTLAERPGVCRECGERAVWVAMECRKPECGARFPANTHNLRQERREAYCPVCDTGNVATIAGAPP